MTARNKYGCRWLSGGLVVVLGLAALPGWGAAPPAPRASCPPRNRSGWTSWGRN